MDANTYQERVGEWMQDTFSEEIRANSHERAMRFLEEAIELCQSLGLQKEKAEKVLQYVYDRPVGVIHQEIGGVMVTLAALCQTHSRNMMNCGEIELTRINQPAIKAKIQAKQVTKSILGITPEELK